jgi:hypothetical protein
LASLAIKFRLFILGMVSVLISCSVSLAWFDSLLLLLLLLALSGCKSNESCFDWLGEFDLDELAD